MSRHFLSITTFFLLPPVVGAVACGGGDITTPPTTGIMELTTSTTGVEPDPDGYTVQLDVEPPQPIGSAATLRMVEVAGGSHTVQLAGVAANCTVSGDNPRTVSVTAGEVTAVTFAVICSATTGSLEITSSTSGSSPDADGYTIILDGANRGPLGVSAAATLTGLTPGSHALGLSDIAANCQVSEDNPRAVSIAVGASTAVAFSVTCATPPPGTGTIRITTVTSGPDQDPDGYAFVLDDGSSQPIGVNSVATLASVAAGSHSVQLSGLVSNCAVQGTTRRPVTVSAGTTAELSFAVSCTAITAGRPSASKSSVTASPGTITLQGTSTITVSVRDENGTPLSGVPVSLSSSGTGNTINPASLPSGTNGKATFTYSSTVAETKTITARAGIVEVAQKATVTVQKVASTIEITSDEPDESTVNQSVRVTFIVSGSGGTPSGDVTVTVSNGPEMCTGTLTNGSGSCDVVLVMPGTGADNQRIITASYPGDPRFAGDSDAETHHVRNRLELVSARDHIPGSFVSHRVVYADRDRIYLGAYQGSLFVLARDRAADFPIIQTIDLGTSITGVRGDADRLYVTTADGLLRVFAKGSLLTVVATRALSTHLGTVEVFEEKIYVTVGQAELAVDRDRLYLARLNDEGESALELDKVTLEVTRTYGETFLGLKTVVYDRLTGALETTIPNPADLYGSISFPRLHSDGQSLIQTIAGCCGAGITIVKGPEFTESEFIGARFTNVVAKAGTGLLGGSEAGWVDYFEQNQLVITQQLDLRILTGHTGGEDIEIRSMWADGLDDLVFAGSSWGNDTSRSLSLPAFFVLSLK
jgi:Big-like domain-containing protein